jgi:DNA-binding transcriptional LysR family regulator
VGYGLDVFTLGQVRAFVTVAEELHFGRAADRLHMTQPPLTRLVQNLERAIGVQLLDRDRRGVTLTAAGAAFLPQARRLLAVADSAPDLARRVAAGSAGSVRIGFMPSATWEVLPALIERVEAALPDVDLDLFELGPREQVEGLRSGELDLGLTRPGFAGDHIASRVVKREDLVLAVPVGHRLATTGRPAVAADLRGEPLILYAPGKARYFHTLVVGLLQVDQTSVVHSVGQVLTSVWLAAAGRGIAFVPASTARLGVPGVEYVPLADVPPRVVEMHLLWSTESDNPATARVLRAVEDVEH